jgi:hypothetical protein
LGKALEGHWREEHLFALRQAISQDDFVQQQLSACDTQIEACLQVLTSHSEPLPLPVTLPGKRAKATRLPLMSRRICTH